MQIIKKLAEKNQNPANVKTPTIAFLGDSVTQGCFELYMKDESHLGNVLEEQFAYHAHLSKILSLFFPKASVNIVNAGLAGDNAKEALKRFSCDVLSHKPDLTVVCFGLNDSNFGLENLENYRSSLEKIFVSLKETGSEIIFMTPNMMNTYVSENVAPPMAKGNAKTTKEIQNSGIYDRFIDEAKSLCSVFGIPVCDCYQKWKTLFEKGVDVTELLANKINHPVREMHWLFAGMLVNTMFEN